MEEMQDIIGFIKSEMEARGMTYEQLAKNIGTTKQNLWIKLNKSIVPNFETIRKVLEGLDYELVIEEKQGAKMKEDRKESLECFFESTEEERVSYGCVEKMLSAIGYELKIKTRENEHKVKNSIDSY